MSTEIEICLPATMRGLTTALATIDQFRAARNLDADQIARARIAAEELISNTIKYGYGGECDRPIWLRLSAEPVFTLTLEDRAKPFDPTAWRVEDTPSPLLERREGRAGIGLVIGLSSTVQYQQRPDGNRVVLTFAARP